MKPVSKYKSKRVYFIRKRVFVWVPHCPKCGKVVEEAKGEARTICSYRCNHCGYLE